MSSVLNGVAHTCVCVSDLEASKPFYRALLEDFFQMTCVTDSETWLYYIGGRTGFAIIQAQDKETPYRQFGIGSLHHICWRVRTKESVNKLHNFLLQNNLIQKHGGKIVQIPKEGLWAPGYYSLLFEDRDGIRLEVNFIPGKGLLSLDSPHVQAKL